MFFCYIIPNNSAGNTPSITPYRSTFRSPMSRLSQTLSAWLMCIMGFALIAVPATALSLPVAESETFDFEEKVEAVHTELQTRVRHRNKKMRVASSRCHDRYSHCPHPTKRRQFSARLRAEFKSRNGFGGPMSS